MTVVFFFFPKKGSGGGIILTSSLGLLSLGTTRVGRWGTERAHSDRGESMAANGGDQSDAVAIPTELSVKHPLQNAWVLWFDNPVKRLGAKDWSSNLKKVPGQPIILWACTPACLWRCPCLWRGPVPSLAAGVSLGRQRACLHRALAMTPQAAG